MINAKQSNRGSHWDSQSVAVLSEFYKKGLSQSEIANKMGVTKGMVSAKIARLISKGELKRIKKSSKTNITFRSKLKKKKTKPIRKSISVSKLLPSKRISILQLKANTCRFITSDSNINAEYCGHEVKEDSAYCQAHHEVCYIGENV